MPILETLRGLFSNKRSSAGRVSFGDAARAFRQRIVRWPAPGAPPVGATAGVLVTPWMKTAVPFFSLECAMMLRFAGCRVRVFFDATDLVGNSDNAGEIAAIREALAGLPADVEVFDAGASRAVAEPGDDELADAMLRENAIRKMRGEVAARRFLEAQPLLPAAVRAHLAKVLATLRHTPVDWLLIPGGIYGVSAAYLAAAQRLGSKFSVFDSGFEILLLSHAGLAAHLSDSPAALAMIAAAGDPEGIALAIREGDAELQRRMAARDDFHSQVCAETGHAVGTSNVFVPLNLRWDAAALSRLRLFDSVEHWLTCLLDWAARTPEARLCVRQHPVERFEITRGGDDVGGFLREHSRIGDRLTFVAADDPVSTYDLMRGARVVLPFTSSVGVEAAMLGHPVVLGFRSYYEHQPFVERAETIEEYFTLIERGLAGELAITPEARRIAAMTYYLTHRCGFLKTQFTPAPPDFQIWGKIPPEELWAQPETSDLRAALLTREPLLFIRHQRRLREQRMAFAS